MDEFKILKYPRTQHLEGSRLQAGDEDLSQVPFATIKGRVLTVEEKFDGANTGISFDANGALLLQSRGHYLRGGGRERDYELFKQWANAHAATLYEILGARFIMYGELMQSKHTVFYDRLPHYFLEFDIYDRERGVFLDTASRRALIGDAPIVSVRVIERRAFESMKDLTSLIGNSACVSERKLENLRLACERAGVDYEATLKESEDVRTMEGLYIKIEEDGRVVDRLKYVRASFLQSIVQSSSEWFKRPIVCNLLKVPVESLFESALTEEMRYDEP